MTKIFSGPFYQISFDRKKNRIYIELYGVWEKMSQVNHYLTHLGEAVEQLEPGFTVIADIRELEECSVDLNGVHVAAQKMIMKAGIQQLAEIHKLHDPVSELSISLALESKISLNIFESVADAEAWLDDLH